jgi:hypothetical protein
MPRQYSNQQRDQARQLYESHGSRRASEQTGIDQRTIQKWAKSEGWRTRLASVSASGPELSERQRLGWALRKQGLADDAAEAAAITLALYMQRAQAGKIYGLLEMARAFAHLTERAAEMSAGLGGAGEAPPESAEQAVARINATLDVIEPRVVGDG